MDNRNFSVEQRVRSMVRDEIAQLFGAGNISATPVRRGNNPTGKNGRNAKGRVTNPKTDKRLKKNRVGNA